MNAIRRILNALSETAIARDVGRIHDHARARYQCATLAVNDYREFQRLIGDYYSYHCTACRMAPQPVSAMESQARAKRLLEQAYRRRHGDIVTAYNDAHDGTNSGVRGILDALADGLKSEAMELYVTNIFDTYVAPNSWEDQVEIIRQFIAEYGASLSGSIHVHQPERYARNYNELINAYIESLREPARLYRRL
jgi:predicted metallopeptidase